MLKHLDYIIVVVLPVVIWAGYILYMSRLNNMLGL
jgi:hypothetical protein